VIWAGRVQSPRRQETSSTVNRDLLLSIDEEQADTAFEEPSILPQVAAEVIAQVAHRWRRVLLVLVGGAMLSAAIAFLVPVRYASKAQLMPPDPRAFISESALTPALTQGMAVSGLGASLMNQRTPGEIAIGIMTSTRCLDDIINRFDLRKVYRVKLYGQARKALIARSTFSEDKKSGIISISVEDRDKYRAQDIAQAYIDELNGLQNSLSTSTARRERLFLEERLKEVKNDLDQSTGELAQFSSRNGTLDLPKQGEETMAAMARLEGDLIIAESTLSALKAAYADDNVRVREAQSRVDTLQREVQKIGGSPPGEEPKDAISSGSLPSVRQLPLLGVRYYDLAREMAVQEAVYETLSKQYEAAKVQEAKEIPSVKVLTPPDLAELKSFPPRKIFVLVGTALFGAAYLLWLLSCAYWLYADESGGFKGFVTIARNSLRQSWSQRASATRAAEAAPGRSQEVPTGAAHGGRRTE